jgi:hypothetical protein
VINQEEEKAVNDWLQKIKGCPDSIGKEAALKDLIVAVKNERYDISVIAKVVKRGNLLLELDSILRQARWLKAQKISFVGSLALDGRTSQR